MKTENLNKKLAELDELIIKDLNSYTTAGLGVGVVYDGKLIYAKGFGLANIAEKKPVTPDTGFRIGSISKTFIAIAIMQLMEQGKLKLDDPVNQYLKTYKVQHPDAGAPPVTIRHMLTHTSGIGEIRNLTDIFLPIGGLATKLEESQISLGDYYKGRLSPEIYPGQKWAYANHAFATLGQVIEDVSGMPYEQYMLENVFEPLGMHKSDFIYSDRVRDTLAQGYQWKKGAFEPIPYQRVLVGAAGSIHASVNEMAKYVSALMNGGANENGRVLKSETLEMMFQPQLPLDRRVFSMGLTFFIRNDFSKHRVFEHAGGWPGFISEMYIAPDDKLAVVAFTNSGNMSSYTVADLVLRKLLEVPTQKEVFEKQVIPESPHLWSSLMGLYDVKNGLLTEARPIGSTGGETEIFVQGSKLMMRTLLSTFSKGVELHRADPDDPYLYYAYVEEAKVCSLLAFKTGANGQVERLEMSSHLPFVFYKQAFKGSIKFKALTIAGAIGGLILWCIGGGLLRKKNKKKCCCK